MDIASIFANYFYQVNASSDWSTCYAMAEDVISLSVNIGVAGFTVGLIFRIVEGLTRTFTDMAAGERRFKIHR